MLKTQRSVTLLATLALLAPTLAAQEPHLADVRQLTRGGENAEGYWSPSGKTLIYQRTGPEGGCDQIFQLDLASGDSSQVSPGTGRTTCAYFLADPPSFLYSTTGLVDDACPAPPDRSQGYVWALYDSFEIVVDAGDGSAPVRLTDNEHYDAEATACPADGTIVFTSDRDGDLELYRMRPDGSELTRLTKEPGYDGGAFFSPDCSRIVWRASRPRGEELEDYRRLLAEGLVRPGKLELWVADADGSNAHQVTYLDAASFAPSFFPSGDRIIFSSNYGDPGGREFDLWAIDVAGTRLERVTDSPGFDGFPHFSPDGSRLAFATNRFGGGPHETNLAVARWVDAPPSSVESEADRYLADVAWLADDEREGRGIGTSGLAAAAEWLEARFRALGLEPAGDDGGYRQRFQVPVGVRSGPGTRLAIDGAQLTLGEDFALTGFAAAGEARAEIVAAGYGITAPELEIDDYDGVEVEGRVVVVRRFVPGGDRFDTNDERRYGDLRYKAWNAREHGAVALLVVDQPPDGEADEAPLPSLAVERQGDAGIPVLVLTRAAGGELFAPGHAAELATELEYESAPAENVVARLPASGDAQGAVVIGAHYDHLGHGGPGSMQPDSSDVHNGADDNASGTAALLLAAESLARSESERPLDLYFAAFAGEERGLHGSTHFVRHPPSGLVLSEIRAMLNFDMVGRLRGGLSVLGAGSAREWESIVPELCGDWKLECALGGDGYGPSDQTPFYAAEIPVLHFFTGTHHDYHKPSDDPETLNAAGGARIAALAAEVAIAVTGPLTYQKVEAPPPTTGDVRSWGASLGTIPDYVGAGEGVAGVLLGGVRAGGPAEAAGMRRGDLLVGLAGQEIGDIYDFMFILRSHKPGETVTAVVERDGARVEMEITFGERAPR